MLSKAKKHTVNSRIVLLICSLSLVLFSSCEDQETGQKALLNVILVDTPATWDSVFVNIQGIDIEVLVQGRETTTETFFLEYKPGVKEIEVSALVGGEALLMARGELPTGKIISATLRLGDNHYLFLNERRYEMPLSEPGLSEVPLAFEQDIESLTAYDLLLDFDLERSILVLDEDPLTLQLDPVVIPFSGIGSGEIEGIISPITLKPAVFAIQGTDSVSTHPNTSGTFLFRVPAGSYTIYIDPKDDGYDSLVIQNVQVESNTQTDLERLTLNPKE